MGDFNSNIGEGRRGNLVGEFGMGKSIDRGDRLYEFCQMNSLVVCNTWFKLLKRRIYTWIPPADTFDNLVGNQTDYVLIHSIFRR